MAQKPEGTEDLRIRRTRKMLLEALMKLTVEKGFAAITIADITERAMVNRSTFYRHFLDKYDLLDQYMNDVYEFTADHVLMVEKPQEPSDKPEKPSGLISLLRHVQTHRDFYLVMLGPKGDPGFTQRFRQNTEKRFRHLLSLQGMTDDPNLPPLELRLSYISYAGIGAIMWWLEQGQQTTPEQLAKWLAQLTSVSIGFSLNPGMDYG
jgi:AcrR family transcriptional regulator